MPVLQLQLKRYAKEGIEDIFKYAIKSAGLPLVHEKV